MTSSKVVIKRLQVPLSSIQCALLLPKNALLFSISAILFPRISLLFSRSAFSFLKNSLLFSGIVLCLPEVPYFYFLCTSFSKNDFFSSWWYLLFVPLRAAKRDNICFALVLFPLVAIYWPTYDVASCLCSHSSNKLWLLDARTTVFLKKYKLYQNLFRYKKLETYIWLWYVWYDTYDMYFIQILASMIVWKMHLEGLKCSDI